MEERGQGAIEYILLAGGIIVAAVVIFDIYRQMTQTAWVAANTTTQNASSRMSSKVSSALEQMG